MGPRTRRKAVVFDRDRLTQLHRENSFLPNTPHFQDMVGRLQNDRRTVAAMVIGSRSMGVRDGAADVDLLIVSSGGEREIERIVEGENSKGDGLEYSPFVFTRGGYRRQATDRYVFSSLTA